MHSLDPASKILLSSLGALAVLALAPLAAGRGPRFQAETSPRSAIGERPRWRSTVRPRDGGLELPAARAAEETWEVVEREGKVDIRLHGRPAPVRERPTASFTGATPPLRGLSTGDGWLVGFDSGASGGSLWWFRHDGKVMQHLADGDVRALRETAEGWFAFCAHAGPEGETGALIAVAKDEAGDWAAHVVVELEAGPAAVADEPGGAWLVVAGAALLRVHPNGAFERLVESRAFELDPVSIAVGEHALVWIGMRRYLVRLTPFGRSYREDWFVEADG